MKLLQKNTFNFQFCYHFAKKSNPCCFSRVATRRVFSPVKQRCSGRGRQGRRDEASASRGSRHSVPCGTRLGSQSPEQNICTAFPIELWTSETAVRAKETHWSMQEHFTGCISAMDRKIKNNFHNLKWLIENKRCKSKKEEKKVQKKIKSEVWPKE